MTSESNFSRRVIAVVQQIPAGQTRSYAEVARAAGSERAARAVASLMRRNTSPAVPCHRVVGSDGAMRGYNRGGVKIKQAMLAAEEQLAGA